ncbi:MAG: hypothetical protein K2X81_08435, partial [Candidatus Obscuribacterales bacterium]|nr:hypothetical protein [Candidatus Obscuribacterales bacterium]
LKQQVLAKQDTNPAFSKQDFLLLVYATSTCKVYDAKLQKHVYTQPGWLDVETGDRLRDKYGLTESWFSAADGPVGKAIKRYMSQGQRPQAFIQAVVQNVCDEVKAQDQQASQAAQDAVLRQEREAQRAKEQALENERLAKERVAREAQAKMERQKQSEQTTNNQVDAPNALSLVLVLAGLTVFGFVITFFLRKNKAADKISKWEETIQNLDGWYLELHNEFGTTMNRKPTGQTKKDLERALTSVAEFTLRRNAAPERLDEAKIAFRKNVFPFSSGFARAIDLLTSVPILVEVRKVPIEEADPLKGFYRDLKETPSDLQRNARSFFQEAVIIFSTIEKAGEILSEIETSFANLVKETISELGPKFKEAGIKFEGIELRVTEIRRSFSEAINNAKAKGTIDSDPFALIETLNRFTEEILQLKEASKKLLNLNNRLIDTNRRCIKAENHINQLRSTPVDYRYPLGIGEFPEPAFVVNYRLIDTSGERTVDAWLESSKSSLAQATQIMRFITADPVDRVFGSDMSDLAKLVLRANGDIDQIDAIITFTFKCKTVIES